MLASRMAKAKQQRGRQGIPGPSGPRGPAGPRGQPGQRGKTGEHGKAPPPERKKLIEEVNGHIEDIHRELDVQMKRMSQIQQQVDELRAKVKKLSE